MTVPARLLQLVSKMYFSDFASFVCLPECGQALLDVFSDCGASAKEVNFIASLCGTNVNKVACYELVDDLFDDIEKWMKIIFALLMTHVPVVVNLRSQT